MMVEQLEKIDETVNRCDHGVVVNGGSAEESSVLVDGSAEIVKDNQAAFNGDHQEAVRPNALEDDCIDVAAEPESGDTWYDVLQKLGKLDELDLYQVMHIPRSDKFRTDRARANYHRLSYRFHPDNGGDEASLENFCKLTLAYSTLKDHSRREIYDKHGIKGLFKSESFMDPSVFEIDPFEYYEEFFSGRDPDDRLYFLISGPEGAGPSDSEADENGKDDESISECNELPEVQLSEDEKQEIAARVREIESAPIPTPPTFSKSLHDVVISSDSNH